MPVTPRLSPSSASTSHPFTPSTADPQLETRTFHPLVARSRGEEGEDDNCERSFNLNRGHSESDPEEAEVGSAAEEGLETVLLVVVVAEVVFGVGALKWGVGRSGSSVITHLSPLGCFVLLLLWFSPGPDGPLYPNPINTPPPRPPLANLLLAIYISRVVALHAFLSLPPPLRPLAAAAANLAASMAHHNPPPPSPNSRKEVSFSVLPPSRSGSDASNKGPPPSSSHKFTGLPDADVQRSFAALAKNRRTSLPASAGSLLANRAQSNVSEARGLLQDLLLDKELPGNVVACLKAVNSLLNPSHTNPLHASDLGLPSVIKDPYSGEDITVASGSISRQGTVTWSTVTGATGLPTIEPEPSRSRSSSFWKSEDEKQEAGSGRRGSGQERFVAADGTKFSTVELDTDPDLYPLAIARWDFPIFRYAEDNPQTVLTRMAYAAFKEADLFRVFKIPKQKFFNYFHQLEKGYWEIPYHNRIHATDVVHGCFYFTSHGLVGTGGETLRSLMSALEVLALYTAAAMHDFDHPGRTNAFLVASKDPKAILYNDRAVLENHHSAAAFRLLSRPENNFVEGLESSEYKRFRYLAIELILSTDLKRHFEVLMEFNGKVGGGIDWEEESDKLLVSQMCIKIADINSPTKPFALHSEWTQRIINEFYAQGDEEQSLNLPVSPYMDRNDQQIPKLQDSFISHLISPLVTAMGEADLLPLIDDSSEILNNIKQNHEIWKSRLPASPDQSPTKDSKEGEMTTIEENEDED